MAMGSFCVPQLLICHESLLIVSLFIVICLCSLRGKSPEDMVI